MHIIGSPTDTKNVRGTTKEQETQAQSNGTTTTLHRRVRPRRIPGIIRPSQMPKLFQTEHREHLYEAQPVISEPVERMYGVAYPS
jgi:hypothetical protein